MSHDCLPGLIAASWPSSLSRRRPAVAVGAAGRARAPRNAAEFDTLFQQVKNWGRWGPDDQLGSVNLITDGEAEAGDRAREDRRDRRRSRTPR